MNKRNTMRLVALFLCILLIPTAACAATWVQFIETVNMAIETSGNAGDIAIDNVRGETEIDGPSGNDAALTSYINYLGYGDVVSLFTRNLILSGLTFKNGMWITSGNYVFENVTIESTGNGIEIIRDADNITDVDLALDEDTTITSDGTGIHAGIEGDSADITIHNAGEITAGVFDPDNGQAAGGIFIWANTVVDASIDITNEGDITSTDNDVVRAESSSMHGSTTSLIHNTGDGTLTARTSSDVVSQDVGAVAKATSENAVAEIKNDSSGKINVGNVAFYAYTYGDGAQATVTNSSDMDMDGVIMAVVYNSGSQATAIHEGTGAIGGIEAQAAGDNSRAVAQNIGGGEVRGEYFGINVGTGGTNTSIEVTNNGTVTGDAVGLDISAFPGTDITVNNTGSIQGTGELQGVFGSYTGVDTVLSLVGMNSNLSEELKQQLLAAAASAGIMPANGDSILLAGYSDQVILVEFLQTSTPTPQSDPEPIQQSVAVEEEEPPPPPVKVYPSYCGICYSPEWLYQSFLGLASRDLRVFELTTDEDGFPAHDGNPLLFKESLGSDGNNGIAMTLLLQKPIDDPLCVIGYPILSRMDRLGITVLNVVNGDDVDSYPLGVMLDALNAAGYNKDNCAQLFLAGMDGDAVIIDMDGNKIAL